MKRTKHVLATGCICFLLFCASACRSGPARGASDSQSPAAARSQRVYIGGYTPDQRGGIQLFSFDPVSGSLVRDGLAGKSGDPAFLTISPDLRFLFAVNEMSNIDGKGSGGVSAFAIDAASGKLTFINQRLSGGSVPCYVSLDAAAKHLFVANWGSGGIEVLPVDRGGKLGEPTTWIQHKDPVPGDKPRQARAHWIASDPTGKFVLVCDLGLDSVFVYHYDADKGTLTAADPPAATVKKGSGPRHLVFSRDGRFAYVICELSSTLIAFRWDAEHGTLKEIQSLSTLPQGYEGKTSSAEIRLHPSGRFLYASNRGNNTITIFQVDPASGMLAVSDHVGCGGITPRGFSLDPAGNWLVVGNQGSDNLVSFKIDQQTGGLTKAAHADTPAPADVLFVPSAH